MGIRVLFAAFLSVFLAFGVIAQEPAPEPDGITEPIQVTHKDLRDRPEFFHGKRILIKGFLVKGWIYPSIWESKEDFLLWKLGLFDENNLGAFSLIHSLEIETTYEDPVLGDFGYNLLDQFERVNVRVVAIFDATTAGYNSDDGTWGVMMDGFGLSLNPEKVSVVSRPEIPTFTMLKIDQVHNNNIGEKPFFEVIDSKHEEFLSAQNFISKWIEALGNRDTRFLKSTLHKSESVIYTEENWNDISDPNNWYYKTLFEAPSPFQAYLALDSEPVPAIHRQKGELIEEHEPYRGRLACFCLKEDCSDIWPLTFWVATARALNDDFICIWLFRIKEKWEWDLI